VLGDVVTDRLSGKVVFITGMARGQGRSHAVRFAEEGASVIGVDLCDDVDSVDYPLGSEEDLQETVRTIESCGGRVVADRADVRDRDSMHSVLDQGLKLFGRLDCVVANAGVMPTFGPHGNGMAAWEDCLDVILTGTMNTVELCYPYIVDQGRGGSIVLVGSMAAMIPLMRTEGAHTLGMLGYAAAKAGVISLALNYASLLAGNYIRVNSIHPTGVDTPMIKNDMLAGYFANAHPEDLKSLVNAIPVPEITPEDVTNLVLWLCSDESRYFTGQSVAIDAGASLR
jgi:SDR family mycofactocin-dependent oxidoreductase